VNGVDDRKPRRSTSVLRAEQALSVADELDRQYGHGKYATKGYQPYRNPPDDSVYDEPWPTS
jgi:hypothetical protein